MGISDQQLSVSGRVGDDEVGKQLARVQWVRGMALVVSFRARVRMTWASPVSSSR